MSNGGSLGFLDRSLVSPFFTLGRDVGAALQGRVGPANVIAGVFTGGGRDTPQRYLPEILGIPLLVARAGVGDVDADPFDLSQHAYQDTTQPRYGVAADALFMRDSRVGHSTVLNIKNGFEKSLLLSSGWNPYIAKKDASGEPAQGQLFQAGLDGAVRWPLARGVASGEAELTYGSFGNSYGTLGLFGGRAQAAYYQQPYEVALRYAVLFPDARADHGAHARRVADPRAHAGGDLVPGWRSPQAGLRPAHPAQRAGGDRSRHRQLQPDRPARPDGARHQRRQQPGPPGGGAAARRPAVQLLRRSP